MTEKLPKETVDKDSKPIFDGGPTYGELRKWAEKTDVYAIEFGDGYTFFYRPITRSEFKELNLTANTDVFAKEEALCSIAVIWPENYDFANTLGGLPSTLSEDIMSKSGFAATVEAINAKDILENE